MCSVILYGLLMRIRASRHLEEALKVRIDFRWLAEGRSIDYSTFCLFRRNHQQRLQHLFVQLGLLAREAGILKLSELAFDGTKIRANNRRSGSLDTKKVAAFKEELLQKFKSSEAEAEKLDAAVEDRDDDDDSTPNAKSIQSRLREAQRVLAEIERIEAADEQVPGRLPSTDVDCRVTNNKDGGFAPNYTPGAMVDTSSGLVVAAPIIADTNEKVMLVSALDEIEQDYHEVPDRLLADGLFSQGTNLEEMEARQIDFYSPVSSQGDNPAVRDDPTQPVPMDQVDQLPQKKTNGQTQFSKEAFVYDEEQDVYYCPAGKELLYQSTTVTQAANGAEVETRRYLSSPQDCAACAFFKRCITAKKSKRRQVQRDQREELRDQLRQRMSTPEGQSTYARRSAPGERPFAFTKHFIGARQFLMRGMAKVQQEWLWLVMAYNLKLLLPLLGARAGPQTAMAACPLPDT